MYTAAPIRYDDMPYRACGNSGLKLPSITLGLWHNFGDATPMETQRDMLRTAFDHGITHFDLANNYGPPAGSAETNFGEHLRRDFRPYRDELIISSKAGWQMWPGPYGSGGGSRKYLLASLDHPLICTEKDAVKLEFLLDAVSTRRQQIWVVPLELDPEPGFFSAVDMALANIHQRPSSAR